MSKKKITVKVAPGQAVFVANRDVLEHIASLYSQMAEGSEDPESWYSVSSSIIDWMEKTYVPEGPSYEDEEW